MSPYDHARLSVRDFGGSIHDYIHIHKLIDSTKLHLPDMRHRAVLHNSYGIQLCEELYGDIVKLVDGKTVAIREVARRHILQDCGCVPTLKETIESIADGSYNERYNRPNKKDLEWLEQNT